MSNGETSLPEKETESITKLTERINIAIDNIFQKEESPERFVIRGGDGGGDRELFLRSGTIREFNELYFSRNSAIGSASINRDCLSEGTTGKSADECQCDCQDAEKSPGSL